jgi:hypothetical protein
LLDQRAGQNDDIAGGTVEQRLAHFTHCTKPTFEGAAIVCFKGGLNAFDG